MRPSIRLGRIFGIDVGLHYSWLVIAVLIVISLAGHFQETDPQWGTGAIWSFAVATAMLFFASILAHELSHAAAAKRRGLPVKSITLFALGGVANIEKESNDARSEFWIAIVGPITSFAIGVVFLGFAGIAAWQNGFVAPETPLWTGLLWLGYINVA